jgi:outer membrane protein assembly factor BamB
MTKPLNMCLIVSLLCIAAGPVRGDWPEFRGPWGNGWATAPDNRQPVGLPLHWSEEQNVKWKTAIPHRGWSTPVVADGQVWLTTATVDGHDFFVICVDAESGAIRLNERLFHSDDPEPLGNDMNGYASSTPVLDTGRVYVHFGSYGTACLDATTHKVLWQRTDLQCRHYRGPGSSPILFEDLLILTMDGVDVQYLVALNKMTGRTVWRTDRTADWNDLGADGKPVSEGDLRKAYSTPLVVDANGTKQMLSVGAKALYGYDPKSGRELWKVNHRAYSGAARPVYGKGIAYMITGFGKTDLFAIDVSGRGDVTDSHLLWKISSGMPRTPSPVLVGDLLFAVSDTGTATCLDARTGTRIWREFVRGHHAASPLYADGRIYYFDQQGKTTVLKASREYEVLATNTLDGGFMASPAVSGKALLLRTKTHLYRIESGQ